MNETETRSAAADWLRPILPDYAQEFVTSIGIDWHNLLKGDRMVMYSSGEKSAIALAAMLEDRVGVVREVLEYQHSVQSLMASLSYVSRQKRVDWIAILVARVMALPE